MFPAHMSSIRGPKGQRGFCITINFLMSQSLFRNDIENLVNDYDAESSRVFGTIQTGHVD